MKKTFLLLLSLAFVAVSCKAPKAALEKRKMIDGTWTLQDISYENADGNFKSVLFNDSEAICFEGSQWFFRNNNSTGKYSMNASTLCNGGDRWIRWSVVDNPENYSSQLQFKMIDENYKDISGGLGYRLNITNLTEQQMTLKSNAKVDGETINIVYKFNKQS